MTTELQNELENLAHTLIDLKTLSECNKHNLEKCQKIQERIVPRITMLEERLDRLTQEAKYGQS